MNNKLRSSFREDMDKVWGKTWSVCSEIGKLKAVLMRRPGNEIEGITSAEEVYMREIPNPIKAREEHDYLVEIYKQHGIKVYYIDEMDVNCPNAMYCRDLVLGTPEGVIIARPGIEVRSKEVKYVAKKVMEIGIPIIKTIHGDGFFDGACLTWLDRESVIIGTGTRCNEEGYKQVVDTLSSIGVKKFIKISIPHNQNHLDGFLSIVDYKLAVSFPYITPQIIYDELEKRGFKIIEIPTMEEKLNFAANSVALEPGKIIMPQGAPRTVELLRQAGVEVIEVELNEIKKGGGSVHCLTAFLEREEVPLYT